ncbi:MAG: energy transducer TonB [Hyphomicrobiaceae bacterium]
MNPFQAYLDSPRRMFWRWTLAGVIVLALHIGGAAVALMAMPPEEPDEAAEGAMVVELAEIAASPQNDQQHLAIGPRADESEDSPPPVEEVKETQPEEVEKIEELPRAEEAEAVLPAPTPEKQEEEKEKEPEKEERATPASVASVAAAPPPLEAPPGPKATAPTQGVSRRPSRQLMTWQKSLALHLNRHKRYPSAARQRSIKGMATVLFTIDRTGAVVTVRIIKGSGSSILDEEAMAMLRRASPLPAPPPGTTSEALTMSVPISFEMR